MSINIASMEYYAERITRRRPRVLHWLEAVSYPTAHQCTFLALQPTMLGMVSWSMMRKRMEWTLVPRKQQMFAWMKKQAVGGLPSHQFQDAIDP